MSWDVSSILFDHNLVRGIIRLQTPSLDISWADWNTVQSNFPKSRGLNCESTIDGLLKCTYNSDDAGDFSIKPDAKFCCQGRSPRCCIQKGGFNIDCPDNYHILFQKMVSEPAKTKCVTPPDSGGAMACTTTAISSCYKACGKLDCISTCTLGNATARCVGNITDPIPKCPHTCSSSSSSDCNSPTCLSNEGKCGTGDIWQSSGNIDNLYEGSVLCEFYFNFDNYDRTQQLSLLNWIMDLFQYTNQQKPKLPEDFSIPLLLGAFTNQTSILCYNEMYSQDMMTPFTSIKLLSRTTNISSYVKDVMKPLQTGISQSAISKIVSLPLFTSQLSKEIKLPTFTVSSQTLSIRINPLQFHQFISYENDDERSLFLSNLLNSFLRESKTSFYTITGDGTHNSQKYDSQPCSLKNPKISTIATLAVSQSRNNNQNLFQQLISFFGGGDSSFSFLTSFQLFDYTEQFVLPNATFAFAYDIVCEIDRFSPILIAYITNLGYDLPVSLVQKMYSDANVYPYPFAFKSLPSDVQNEECRKQIRNDALFNTVNDLGILLYGYYSPDCKCIISNIAPIGQSQFMNLSSMCFDLNCNSPYMINRYDLSDEKCSSTQVCNTVQQWGSFIQNSQNLNNDRFENLCQKQNSFFGKQNFSVPILILGSSLTILVAIALWMRKQPKQLFSKVLIMLFSCLTIFGISLYLSFELYGVPVCVEDPDGHLQTECHTQISHLKVPMLFCENRYRWCECVFNTEDCFCKSGILVPQDGQVDIQTMQVSQWNIVYGLYITAIFILLMIILTQYAPTKNLLYWSIIFILIITLFVAYYLCFSSYIDYKNKSKCSSIK